MKIGINAGYAVSEVPTGIGNYIFNLIKGLQQLRVAHELILYYRSKIKKKNYLPFPLSSSSFEPWWFFQKKIDLFHDPAFKYIKIGQARTVVTVHDIVVALPEDYTSTRFKKKQMPKLLKTIHQADKLIAVSEFTRKELIEKLGVPENKIAVVLHGVDTKVFKPAPLNPQFLKENNLPERYILYVGNIEKRKNITGMLKAFEKILQKDKDIFLILLGKNGYSGDELRQQIRQSPALKNIIFKDYIPNPLLASFYQHAQILFFPSFYEGFGIPVLEAQACGCPVLTSYTASLPEAGGNAALYADPFRPDEIVDKALELLNNNRLCQELKQKGLEHIKMFTWQRTAEKTMAVYESLL